MKKFSLFLLSLFVTVSLMAQLKMTGPAGNYPASNKTDQLYSQMTSAGGAYASQEFPDFTNCRLQSADDFIVPSGSGWDIIEVEALGTYWNGTNGPSPSFIVEIYADNAGLPAITPLFSQNNLSYIELSGLFTISLSGPIHLAPGHYWISIMAEMPFSPNGQWGWQAHAAPQINNEFANQDPCSLLGGSWPGVWGSGSSTIGGLASYDFCFALYSPSAPPAVPIGNWPIYLGFSLILATIIVRYRKNLIKI